jgi:hypothetical protein
VKIHTALIGHVDYFNIVDLFFMDEFSRKYEVLIEPLRN